MTSNVIMLNKFYSLYRDKFGFLDCVRYNGDFVTPGVLFDTFYCKRPKNMELAKYKIIYKFRSQMQPHVCNSQIFVQAPGITNSSIKALYRISLRDYRSNYS